MSQLMFVQLLSTNGDGTGETEVTGNYSVTPETFEITPPVGGTLWLARMLVFLTDTAALDAAGYGNGAELANGLTLTVRTADDEEIMNLTPEPIKSNGDWAGLAFDTDVHPWGIGPEILAGRLTFTRFSKDQEGIVLHDGSRLVLTASDSLIHLIHHRFTVQGWSNETYVGAP